MGCRQSKSTATINNASKKLVINSEFYSEKIKKAEKKDNKDKQYTFKIAMLGGSSVGKTSLVSFYCLGSKKQTYGPTVGGAYFKKEATGKDGQKITMNIWDTAGQQKYRSMVSLYYRDADVIMIVFDLTDLESFYQLDYWIGQLQYRLEADNIVMMIVGNKMDLPERKIKRIDMINWINKNYDKCIYKQASALTGAGVEDIFQSAIQHFLRNKNSNKK